MGESTVTGRTAPNRKIRRDEQYARTLVHYLGVEKALAVCKKNTWTSVQRAIVEQNAAASG